MQCLIIPLEFCATRFTLGLLQISVAVLVCFSVFFFFLKKKIVCFFFILDIILVMECNDFTLHQTNTFCSGIILFSSCFSMNFFAGFLICQEALLRNCQILAHQLMFKLCPAA
jgi:hypothetical protein